MVIFAGQAGRPTAGVTQESHSIAGVVRAVSGGLLGPSGCSSPRTPPSSRRYDPAETTSPRPPPSRAATAGCGPALRATSELGGRACSTATRASPPPPPSRVTHRPGHRQRRRASRPAGPGRLVRPGHPAAGGDGGPRPAAVRRRHRLRQRRARRARQRPVRRHRPRSRRRALPAPWVTGATDRVNAFLDRLRGGDPMLMLAIRSSRTRRRRPDRQVHRATTPS